VWQENCKNILTAWFGRQAADVDEIRREGSFRRMRIGTKLILLLTLAVGTVMTLGGNYILCQREAILETAMRNEVRAHATTLRIALGDAYRSGRTSDAQRLINRLSKNPKIYSIELVKEEAIRDDGRFVAIRISDTGPGIPAGNLNHIFDPFFTTKDVGQGSGLGLAVSHRIVEEHGGWIEVGNQQTGGAVFAVYLPKAEVEEESSADCYWPEL
jgi:hypothetical protein